MDLLTSSKDKLAYFRIKELKDVLTQLGLNKQGKKQDLIDRILSLFSDDDAAKPHGWNKRVPVGKDIVAKLIDDIHRTLQINGATDLASKGQNGSGLSSVKPKEEVDMKIRCPCGSSLMSETMIQCDDPRCKVWQHIGCVIIPEKPMEGIQPEVPKHFYCEICRINRADPFWVTVTHPLIPVKLTASNMPADGTNPVQSVEKTFQLTRADRDLLQKTEYDLQAWCILLNDMVSFRMQWPQYSDLQVNGVPVRTTNRPGSQLLGNNSRDDGPPITTFCREGINKVSLSGCDARIFCIGVRIVRRRTVQQVLNLIPKETDGERFEEALARVCRCIGGGGAAENADSDSDLEVVADSITVNLRCPMSGSRMKIAGRFKPCVHMGCFDLETFVELNQRSRKWQCPICLKNYSLENIIIDPYFNRIASLMQDCGEDVNEIDVKPDGSWRARNENEVRDLARWHNPDGSVCVTADGGEAQPEISKLRIKEEFPTDEHTSLKIGIKRNHNGIWEVSKPEDLRPNSSGNNVMERFDNPFPKVMSSGATGSYKDDEDASVNQEGGGHFEFSTNNGNEHESVNFGLPCSAANRNPAAAVTDADVIVLSDSEEENVTLISPETVCGADPTEFGGISFPVHAPGVSGSYPEDDNACLGLFSNNADDFGMPIWSLPTAPQGSGFQLFGPHTDVTDALVDESGAQSNGYGLSTDTNMGTSSHVQNTLVGRSNAEADGLVDNPLAFGNDPSLQIFLPARPAGASVQDEARDHADMSNGIRSEDWISLRLGGGTSHTEPIDGNDLHSRKHHASKDGGMGPSNTDNNGNNAASFFQNMNNGDDGRSDKAGWRRPRSGDPFSHPRQPRSVRPRLPLSIDIDSE